MVGVRVGVEYPLETQVRPADIIQQGIGAVGRCGTRFLIEVENRIDDGAGLGVRIAHHVLDRIGARVEKMQRHQVYA